MRIVATSDIHGLTPDLDGVEGDVLVIAGDLTANHKNDYIGQAAFINRAFEPWCGEMRNRFDHIITIAGNHDVVFEDAPELIYESNNYIYLQDEEVVIDGVKFWGTPWTIPFFDWGFNADDKKRDLIFSQIPEGVDVLISHGPPNIGRAGMVNNRWNNFTDEDKGDKVLRDHIIRTHPKFVFCGHIHEGYGHYPFGMTDVYNCSLVNEIYDERPPGQGYFILDI